MPTIDAVWRGGIRSFLLVIVEEVRLLEVGWIGNVDASSVVLAQFAVVEDSRGIRCPEIEKILPLSVCWYFLRVAKILHEVHGTALKGLLLPALLLAFGKGADSDSFDDKLWSQPGSCADLKRIR